MKRLLHGLAIFLFAATLAGCQSVKHFDGIGGGPIQGVSGPSPDDGIGGGPIQGH